MRILCIRFFNIAFLWLLSSVLILNCLVVQTSHAQVVNSFQKISSTQGGFTEAGGELDNLDDFGEALNSIGDLNGDGITDLAVGVIGDDDGGSNRGAVYILFMNTDGTVSQVQKISSLAGGFPNILDNEDDFGKGVAGLGDLDGDGVVDIAVGANKDDDGGADKGAIYILFMNPNGTVKSHQKISATSGGFTGQLTDGNWFASDLESLGDFDNDGITDLIVSQERSDDGGENRGAVWLLFLNADGTVKSHQKISATAGGFEGTLDDNDQFGQSAAAIGDLNNDGTPDIAVGSENDDDGGFNRGAVWILFLNPNGTVKSHQKISATQGGFSGLLEDGDEFGQSVTTPGDLNNDGIQDLVIGSEHADSPDGNDQKTGELWIVYLNSNGTALSQAVINADTENFTSIRKNANLGQAVTFLGDLNEDGINDIAASADGDRDGGLLRGSVFAIFLNATDTGNSPLK